ncbi:LysR family transcriptional regulator [Mucilaginibacter celer]|uniref:LysR family transcriptional regulator n=1 Tax=Mucilaginibacter celer TaxID=2305508 RepID=A0A494VMQ5_9SPHI|nr:LysR family transcriptional regulator [Mucilaginibacter celer]AYL94951.1 LysR family transcriptional regulator [Mucilaginibacter celer]
METKILNLFKIKVLSEVCKNNSYKITAANLHITASAVSKIIKSLEGEWGIQLVNSTGNNIKLTDKARQLENGMADLLKVNDLLLKDILQLSGKHSEASIRFGSGGSHTKIVTGRLLPLVIQAFPDINFEVKANNSGEAVNAIVAGELDCGIVSGELPDSLDRHFIFDDQISLYAHRDNPLVKSSVSLNEISYPICLREKGSSTRTAVEKFLDQQHISLPVVKQTSNNDELTHHLCKTQHAMLFLPDFYYHNSHWKNEYVKIDCMELPIPIPVYFVTGKGFVFKRLKKFIQQIPFQQEILAT